MTPLPESMRATARRLRREEGLSVRQIAARLGIGRSTAGNYVQGVEAERVCAYCGRLFWSENAWRRYCCDLHRRAAKQEREYPRLKADPARYARRLEMGRRAWHARSPEQRERWNARKRERRRERAAAAAL